ncbi:MULTISPECIES: glycosyltransferase [unclassified Streptomyces]|uniref:glycosyltransferase n=1 Tax=unclassified Streptomyces TaxID=2593676 RepID=UPI000DB977AE|nr:MULTISPECIES: glycosyltransferase [unclassified Streptomyces]MYT68189.1 glycosyltransferase [Streptomyces sp. SID8367]RAJ72760.1 glycosyl transferase family 2 [Streptomyces sp. PsTaAH-137]
MPSAVAVVVPAHDEAHRIGACLRSVREAAARAAPLPVVTVVAADACADDTAGIAARAGAHVVRLDRRSVGAARAVGTAYALHLLHAHTPDVWLAMTDADSTVPATWLTDQLAWARNGYDVVLGTIRLARAPSWLASLHDDAYFLTRPLGGPTRWEHPHVHGANLGISATAYLRAGGFAPLSTGEDHELVARLTAQGRRIARSDGHPVHTAARLRGRAPGGLADLLSGLHDAPAHHKAERPIGRRTVRPSPDTNRTAAPDTRAEPTTR